MPIELKEVHSKRDLKSFIYFPFMLYRKSNYWTPPFMKFERLMFNRNKNPMYELGDAKLFIALKNRAVVGRVAILALHDELEQEKKVRFGWFDFIDDKDVSAALMAAVEEAAAELNATSLEGPLGFTNFDRTGVLIDGFKEETEVFAGFEFPYFQRHFAALDFEPSQEYVTFLLPIPDEIPLPIAKIAARVKGKSNLRKREIITKKELQNSLVDILKHHQQKQHGVSFSTEQALFYLAPLWPFLTAQNVFVFENEKSEMKGYAVIMEDISKSAKRTNGFLTPFSFLPFFRQPSSDFDLLFLDLDNSLPMGSSAVLIEELFKWIKTKEISTLTTHLVDLKNTTLITRLNKLNAIAKKKRAVYRKTLT